MRGDNESRWSSPMLYLRLLQNLTFQTYEENKCTSGFICVTDIKMFLAAIDKKGEYTFSEFVEPIFVMKISSITLLLIDI